MIGFPLRQGGGARSVEEAVAKVDATGFGMAVSVFTSSVDNAKDMAESRSRRRIIAATSRYRDPGGSSSPQRHVPALQPTQRDVATIDQPQKHPDQRAGPGSQGTASSRRLSSGSSSPQRHVPAIRAAAHRRNVTFLRFSRWNVTLRRWRWRWRWRWR